MIAKVCPAFGPRGFFRRGGEPARDRERRLRRRSVRNFSVDPVRFEDDAADQRVDRFPSGEAVFERIKDGLRGADEAGFGGDGGESDVDPFSEKFSGDLQSLAGRRDRDDQVWTVDRFSELANAVGGLIGLIEAFDRVYSDRKSVV